LDRAYYSQNHLGYTCKFSLEKAASLFYLNEVLGQKYSSKLNDEECDNVLRDQGSRTIQGPVMDEYGTMVD
jgi:hypothetical protein